MRPSRCTRAVGARTKIARHAWVAWLLGIAAACALPPEGTPAPRRSLLVAELAAVPADGASRARVRLTLNDATGVGVPQVNVRFFANPNVLFFQPSATDANGEAVAYLSSAVADEVVVGAQTGDGNVWVTLPQTVSVRFLAVDAKDANLLVLQLQVGGQNLVADGNDATTVDLVATEAGERPLAGSAVTLRALQDGVVLEPNAGVISSLGTFSATVRSTWAGQATVRATVQGMDADAPVTFVAGPFDANASRLTSDTNTIGADGASLAALTLWARDAFDNPVVNLPVSFRADRVADRLLANARVTNAAGACSAALTSTALGVATVSADVAGHTLQLPVAITAPLPSVLFSRIAVADATVQADGLSSVAVAVTVRDALQRPLAGHAVRVGSVDPADQFLPDSGVTDANGLFVTQMRSQHAGAKSIIAALEAGYVATTATFLPLDADPVQSTFLASPSLAPASGRPLVRLLLQARDTFGNPAAYEPVSLSASGNAVVTPPLGQTDGNGLLVANVADRTAGNVLVTATLRSTALSTPVKFVPGDPNAALSRLSIFPSTLPADGASRAIVVATFVDAFGNEVDDCNVQFTTTLGGTALMEQTALPNQAGTAAVHLSGTVSGVGLVNASCNGTAASTPVTFLAGPVSFAHSTLSALPSIGVADGNSAVVVVLRARDARNNPAAGQPLTSATTGPGGTLVANANVVGADGTLTLRLRASVPGVQVVQAVVGGVPLSLEVPFVAAGPAAANCALVVDPPSVRADALSVSHLSASVRDASGNPVVNVPVHFVVGGANNVLPASNAVTDAYGVAQVSLASARAENKPVAAQVANFALAGNVLFVPGALDVTRSRLSVATVPAMTLGGLPVATADGSPRVTVRVRLADAFDNPLPGVVVAIDGDGDADDVLSVLSSTTNAAGEVVASFGSIRAGVHTVRATVGALRLEGSVRLVAGAADANHCSLVASAQNVVADGASPLPLRVVVADAYDNPVGGQQVRLATSGPAAVVTDVFDVSTPTTSALGVAEATLRARVAGTKTLSAQVAGLLLQQNVNFVAGTVSAAASSFSLQPSVGVVGSVLPVTATLVVRDAFGNAVPNAPINVTSSVGSDVIGAGMSTSDANGAFVFTLAATAAGTRTLSLQAGQATWRMPSVFLPGPPAAGSSLSVSPNAMGVDDAGSATVRLVAVDAYDNPVAGANVTLATSGVGVLGTTAGVTSADGTLTTSLDSTVTGLAQVTATLAAPGSGNVVVTLHGQTSFFAGPVDTARLRARITPYPPKAGQIVTGAFVVSDMYNNRVPGIGVTLVSSVPTDDVSPGYDLTDANGIFHAQGTFTQAGLRFLTTAVGGTSQTVPFLVLPGDADANTSSFGVQPSTVVANGLDVATLTVTARDTFGNPATNQLVSFATTGATTPQPASVATDALGIARATLSQATAGTATATATLGNVVLAAPVQFVAGAADATRSILQLTPAVVVADDVATATLTLALADVGGNPVPNRPVRLLSATGLSSCVPDAGLTDANGVFRAALHAAVAHAEVVTAQADAIALAANLTFVAGPPDPNRATFAALPPVLDVDLPSGTALLVRLQDTTGNPVGNVPVRFFAPVGAPAPVPAAAVSDATGFARARWTPQRPGVAQLRAEVDGPAPFATTTDVTVYPGALAAATSTLTLAGGTPVADGNAALTVSVALADDRGNPLAGELVTIEVGGGNNMLAAASGVTDANGLWSSAVRSTRAESKIVAARAGALVLSAVATFVPGAPSADASRLTTSTPTPVADGLTAVWLTAEVRDARGNPVPAQTVSLLDDEASDLLAPTSCVSGADGTCTVALVATRAGDRTLTATVGGAPSVTWSRTVHFVAGGLDADASTMQLLPNAAVANGSDAIVVRISSRDAQGNPVGNVPVALQAQGQNFVLSPASGTSDANGLFVANLTATVTGPKVVAASLAGTSLSATAWFLAGPVDANHTAWMASSGQVTADGAALALLTLVAADSFGNPVGNVPVSFAVSGGNAVLDPPSAVTDAQGIARTRASATVPAALQVQASAGNVVVQLPLQFVAGAATAARSSLTLQPAVVAAGTPATVSVLLRDALGNPVPNQPVTLGVGGGNVLVTQGAPTTDANGTWTATVSTTRAQSLPVSVQAGTVQLTGSLAVQAAAADANASALAVSPNLLVANGVSAADVVATLRDAYGNPVFSAPVSFSADAAGTTLTPSATVTDATGAARASVAGRIAGAGLVRATAGNVTLQANVRLVAGPATDASLSLSTTPNATLANGQNVVSLLLTARDAQGNPLVGEPVAFLVGGSGGALTADPVTDANGLARAELRATVAETKRVTASVQAARAATNVTFVAGAASPAHSTLVALPPVQQADGNAAVTASLTLRDAQQNPVGAQNVTWTVAGAATLSASSGTTDADGRAQVQLTASTAGVAQVATLGGALGANVTFVAGAPSAATSTVTLQPSVATAGVPTTVLVQLRDALGNAVGNQSVLLAVDGGNLAVAPSGPGTDANGLWSATLTSTRAQTFRLSIQAGIVQLVATLPAEAAPADANHSLLTLSPNVFTANGSDAAEAALTLHDAFDNPVVGASVAFDADVAGVTLSPNQAVTNAAGVATIALSGVVAGTGTLTATAGNVSLQQNLQLVAGSASDATVALSASPNLAVADGLASVALLLTVQDAQNNPVAGESVTFVASGTGGQLLADASTDAAGTARATLRSNVAETKRITAVAGTAHAATNVVFVAGEPNATASTLTAFPPLQTADGNAQVTFSLWVRDATQNAVPGRAVSFAGTGVGTLGAAGATTDVTGRAQVVLTSLAAGAARVTTLGGALAANVTFVAGAPAASNSSLALQPSVPVAGAPTTVVVTLRDASGNPVVGQSVALALGAGGNATLSPAAPATDANGVATATLATLRAQSTTLSATAGATQLALALGVRAAAPDANGSTLTLTPSVTVANGTSGIDALVSLADAFGNLVPGAQVQFATSGAGTSVAPQVATSNAAGLAETTLVGVVAGPTQVTAQSGALSLQANASLVAGPATDATCTLVAAPANAVANGQNVVALTLRATDALANPVVGQPVTFSTTGSGGTLVADAATDANGFARATLSSSVAEAKKVTARVQAAQASANVTFLPGAPAAPQSSLVALPSSLLADGNAAATFVLTLRDAAQNPVSSAQVTWSHAGPGTLASPNATTDASGVAQVRLTSTQTGVATLTALGGALSANVTFLPGAVAASQSSWTASPNVLVADGVAPTTLTLHLADAFANPLVGQTVTFGGSSPNDAWSVGTTVTDTQGNASTTLRSSAAGARTYTASSAGSSYLTTVQFVPGAADANASSLAVVPGVVVADGNARAGLVVMAFDARQNPVPNAAVHFAVDGVNTTLSPVGPATPDATGVTLFTDAQGLAVVSAASTRAQAEGVRVDVTSGATQFSLFGNVSFVAGAPSTARASLSATPNVVVADGVQAATLSVRLRDAFDNPVVGRNVALTLAAPASCTPPTGTSDGNGQFFCSARSVLAASVPVSVDLGAGTLSTAVNFVAGPAAVAASTLTASPNVVVADDVQTSQLTLRLRDAQNNPVAQQNVTWSATGAAASASSFAAPTVRTDASGMATNALHARTAGAVVAAANFGGNLSLQAPVSFVAGSVASGQTTLLAAPSTATANGVDTVQLTASVRDALGNPVAGQNVVLGLGAGANVTGLPTSGVTDATGSFVAGVRTTVAQARTATLAAGSAYATAAFSFVAGSPNASASALVGPAQNVVADAVTPANFALTVRDTFGNLAPGVPVAFTTSSPNATLSGASAVTNAGGVATVSLTTPLAGSYGLTASYAGLSATANATFVAGSPNMATSSLVCSPNVVTAGLAMGANCTVTARDARGNPVLGQTVTASADQPAVVLLPATGSTGSDGRFSFTATDVNAQTTTLTANLGTAAPTSQVKFVAGPPDANRSSFAVNPNQGVANGNNLLALVVTLVDAFGNRVPNVPVSLSSSGTGNAFNAANGNASAFGMYSATLSSTVAEAKVLQATAGNVTLAANATFVAGAPAAARSALVASPNVVVADGVAATTLTLVAKDASNNPVPGQAVTLASSGGNNAFSPQSGTTDGNGLFAATLRSNVAETKTVAFAVGGTSVNAVVAFVAGAPAVATSTFVADRTNVTADGTSQVGLTLTLRDASGNPVSGQAVSFTGAGAGGAFSVVSGNTGTDGTLRTALSATGAGPRTVQATFAGLTLSVPVGFTPGSPAAATSVLTGDVDPLVADGVAKATLVALLRDAQGNPVPGQSIAWSSSGANTTLNPNVDVSDANGRATVRYAGTTAGATTVTAQVGATALRLGITLVAGPANANASSFAVAPASLPADGVSLATATLRLRDAYGNAVAGQNVLLVATDPNDAWTPPSGASGADGSFAATLATTRMGVHGVTAQAGNFSLAGSANFLPGALSAATSSLTLSPNVAVADGNASVVVAVALRDAYGNPVAGQNVTLAASGSNVVLAPSAGQSSGAGAFVAQLSTTRAEAKRVTATAGAVTLAGNATFVAGPVAAATTTLSLTPNVVVADGASLATAVLTLRDAQGNPVPGQSVAWSTSGANVLLGASSATTDVAGAANVTVRSAFAQTANFTASVGATSWARSIAFVAGPASAGASQLVLSPNRTFVANGNDAAHLVVTVADAQANPVANQNVVFSGIGNVLTIVPPAALTDANGVATADVTSVLAADKLLRATFGTAVGAPSLSIVVSWRPGPPSAVTSTLTASPNVVTADGNSASTLTLVAQDAYGNLVPNANVVLAASGANATLGVTAGTTGSDGSFVTTLRSTRAQAQNVTATVGGPGGATLSVPVTFRAGEPSVARSSLAVLPTPVVASATDNANVTLALFDAQNNPVPNVAVTFNASLAGGGLSAVSGATDANGLLALRLHATVVQSSSLQASFGGASLLQNVVVIGAPPSSATSVLTATPNTVLADGNTTVTLRALVRDVYNNQLSGTPVTLTASGGNTVFTAASSGNTTSGQFLSGIASTLAQVQNVTATAGTPVTATFATKATFTAGAPSAGRTTFVASPNVFTADNVASSTLTTTVRDAFANPVPNQNVAVSLSGSGLTQSASSGATGADGTFATTVRTTLAQSLSATASVNGSYTLNAGLTAVPGPTSQLTVAGIAGGTAAVSSVPQVTAFDAYGNLTPSFAGTVALSSTDPVAVLPAPYLYAAADAGTHVWTGPVTLVTPGVQALRAQVVESPGIVGSQNNVVVGSPLFATATLTSRALGSSCLDLQNGALAANTPLIARTCTNLASEVFAFGTDGTLRVLGNCVSISGGSAAAGQPVVGAACTGAPAQRWALSGNGQVRSLANPNFCLDLGSGASGTAATVNACGGGAGQQYFVRSVSPRYALVNGALQQVVEVAGNAIVAGSALQNANMNNGSNQAFAYGADNVLRIGGLCVQPSGGSAVAGAGLALAACSNATVQQFVLNGNVLQSAANAGLCVDVGSNPTSTQVKLQTCTGGASQTLGAAVQSSDYRYLNYSGISTPLCLDVTAALNAGMPPVLANTCSQTTTQGWSVLAGAGNDITFGPNCLDTQVGLLSLLGLSSYNGQALYANTCSNSATQAWRAFPTSSATYQIRWLATGNYCVNSTPTTGGGVVLGTCNTTNTNQMFAQLAMSYVFSPTANPGLCLEVAGGMPVAGAAVQFNGCTTTWAQSFNPGTDGTLQFNGLCLDVPAGLAAGNVVRLASCNGAASQQWSYLPAANTQSIVAVRSSTAPSLCFDPSAVAAGTPLKLGACSGTSAQTFADY